MKILLTVAVLALTTSWVTLASAEVDEAMMAEMENCAVCKHLTDNPALLEQMTWETFKIDNGALCVTTAPKEMKGEFNALSEKMKSAMEQVKADKQAGKDVEVCELCSSMGAIMETGAKEKEIKTANGCIHMMTSDDPAVVQKIHANADQAIAMQKQMANK